MDMLMQILFEFSQAVIERVESRAGIRRSGEVRTQTADFSKQSSRGVVFLRHHCDRIGNRAKAAMRLGSSAGYGLLETSDIGKQNCFFLGQMLGEFFVQMHESGRYQG